MRWAQDIDQDLKRQMPDMRRADGTLRPMPPRCVRPRLLLDGTLVNGDSIAGLQATIGQCGAGEVLGNVSRILGLPGPGATSVSLPSWNSAGPTQATAYSPAPRKAPSFGPYLNSADVRSHTLPPRERTLAPQLTASSSVQPVSYRQAVPMEPQQSIMTSKPLLSVPVFTQPKASISDVHFQPLPAAARMQMSVSRPVAISTLPTQLANEPALPSQLPVSMPFRTSASCALDPKDNDKSLAASLQTNHTCRQSEQEERQQVMDAKFSLQCSIPLTKSTMEPQAAGSNQDSSLHTPKAGGCSTASTDRRHRITPGRLPFPCPTAWIL